MSSHEEFTEKSEWPYPEYPPPHEYEVVDAESAPRPEGADDPLARFFAKATLIMFGCIVLLAMLWLAVQLIKAIV